MRGLPRRWAGIALDLGLDIVDVSEGEGLLQRRAWILALTLLMVFEGEGLWWRWAGIVLDLGLVNGIQR